MRYLLDTDTCIYVINRRPQHVFDRFRKERIGDIGLSSISFAELQYGAEKSSNPARNLSALSEYITPLEILEFGEPEAIVYGKLRTYLQRHGDTIGAMDIGAMDMLIAAHALSTRLVLVTNNTGEFGKVPELTIENWI